MVKTSTSSNAVNFSEPTPAQESAEPDHAYDELFYNNIRPQLNQLIREPAKETLDRIMAYAAQK